MKHKLIYTPKAVKDLERHQKTGDKKVLKKIVSLSLELEEHPTTGTGQVERLKYELAGRWSRRINHEHRLLYDIDQENQIVYIHSLWGHY